MKFEIIWLFIFFIASSVFMAFICSPTQRFNQDEYDSLFRINIKVFWVVALILAGSSTYCVAIWLNCSELESIIFGVAESIIVFLTSYYIPKCINKKKNKKPKLYLIKGKKENN